MVLPEDFKESMKELLGAEYGAFIKSYDEPVSGSLRINTSKINAETFGKIAPFPLKPIPFVSNGYYIDECDTWSKHPYYHAGLYYIQEASAMLPAYLLPVGEDDDVLDMCAAPGGKSTAIAERAKTLVSNDISFSRALALVKNLDHNGTGNTSVTCSDPAKLAPIWKERFDKIAVDAPCSGEGMFRSNRRLIAEYERKKPQDYAALQLGLLDSAYEMLRAGGMIMYSTCTFSDTEDEQVIMSFLDEHADIKVCSLDNPALSGPYDKYAGNDAISGCSHVLPHRCRGEGHFMTLMKKDGERSDRPKSPSAGCGYKNLPESVKQFSELFSDGYRQIFVARQFLCSDDGMIFMLPDGFDETFDKRIRYVRTGTCIGTLNRSGAFTPHTALALSIKSSDFNNVIDLSPDSDDISRYLKGETLTGDSAKGTKGHVMICCNGFPIGFARSDSSKLKNLYEKGWIYR